MRPLSATPDPERFTAFYRENYAQVVAYVRRRSQPDPESVAAEVFAVAWKKHHDALSVGLPWLYRTAFLQLQNDRRSAERANQMWPSRGLPPRRDHASDLTNRLWLGSLIEQLSAKDQEVLKLLYWEDLDHNTAALVLGCRPGTVAVRAHRARNRLQHLIDQSSDHQNAPATAPASREAQPGTSPS